MVSSIAAVCISNPELTDEHGASDYFASRGHRISVRTLQFWRRTGKPPAFHKLGKHVLYSRLDLDRFIADSRVDPAA
jgi:hypothetical protein